MATTYQIEKTALTILPKATQTALTFLSKQSWLKRSQWYLAGGTALALHMQHRVSVDLDFFTPQTDFAAGKLVSHFPTQAWETTIAREGTLYGKLYKAKVSFIAYPFFQQREPTAWYGNVRVLVPKDIAVMKIIAISQRGAKRDFIDLYWYVQNKEPLRDILLRLSDQYPTVAHDYGHILKSLVYFDDAEPDPMPTIRFQAKWDQVKNFFKREVPLTSKTFLHLT